MEDRILQIVLKARDEASGEIEKIGKKAGGVADFLSTSFKGAAIVSGAAVAGLTAEAIRAVGAFQDAEKVMAQTEAVLRSTKNAAGVTADDVSYLASRMQRLTGISDETVQSAQNMLLTFTSIGKNVFPEATKTVLDMSVALGQDTKNSAIQLGKALNDPINGVNALRRVGVQFNDAQQETIQKLVESGKLMEAQKLILAELQVEFGGSAEAAGKTFAGKLNILKNTLGDLEEVIGQLIVNAVGPLVDKFQEVFDTIKNVVSGEESLASLTETLHKQFGDLGMAVGKVVEFFAANRDALIVLAGALGGVLSISILGATAAMMAFVGVSAPALAIAGALGAVAVLVATNWSQITVALQPVIDLVSTLFERIKIQIDEFVNANAPAFLVAWDGIKNFIIDGLTIIKNIWDAVWPSVRDVFAGVWKQIQGVLQFTWGLIQMIIAVGLGVISGDWIKAWTGIKTAFMDIWDGLVGYFEGVWEMLKNVLKSGINTFVGLINGMIENVNKVSSKVGVPPINKIPAFESGGWVQNNGLAFLHGGEYVLSRDMLAGKQPIEAPVTNNNYSSPISLGPIYVQDMSDIDLISQRLAFAMATNGRR